jgi:2-methylisocitrate lyase-like PEP mutase family enzyme
MGNPEEDPGAMTTQADKARAFRALHERNFAFIIPNPWDAGTSRLLAHLGFEALATTSAGYAFSVGKTDYGVGREEMIAHVGAIARATDLPVSADLENCWAKETDGIGETIRMAAATGIVGGSIEDTTNRPGDPIFEIAEAVDRVRAAVEAARALPFPFTLTARAENYLWDRRDLKDTIARLQAFQDAGADVLYAPGLSTRDDIAAVVSSVDRPVNVVMGLVGVQLSLDELSKLGVRRVSVGSALMRAAVGAFHRAAEEMKTRGTFTFAETAANYRSLKDIFSTPGEDNRS